MSSSLPKKPRETFTKHYCRLCGGWIEGTLCSFDCENDAKDQRPSETVGLAHYELVEAK